MYLVKTEFEKLQKLNDGSKYVEQSYTSQIQ